MTMAPGVERYEPYYIGTFYAHSQYISCLTFAHGRCIICASAQVPESRIQEERLIMDTKKTEANELFNLAMPPELRHELEQVAKEHQTTATNASRKFIKLGLVAEKARKKGGGLYIRKDRDSKLQEIDIF